MSARLQRLRAVELTTLIVLHFIEHTSVPR